MNEISERLKGGFSINWKIENFHSTPDRWKTSLSMKWANTESMWKLSLCIRLKTEEILIRIEKLDSFGPFCISGTIFVVVGESTHPLGLLNRCDFNKKSVKYMRLTSLKNIDSEKDSVQNGVLTLRFSIYDCYINDLLAAEYFVQSTFIEQVCSFLWNIDSDDKATHTTEFPAVFTNFLTMQKFGLKIAFLIDKNDCFIGVTAVDIEFKPFKNDLSYKLKIQFEIDKPLQYVDCKWKRFNGTSLKLLGTRTELLNLSHLVEVRDQSHLQWQLVLQTEIVIGSDSEGVIEKTCWGYDIHANRSKSKSVIDSKSKCIQDDSLQSSIYELFKEDKFCDVVLRGNDVLFNCHKAVLCARSSVFRTMFDNHMLERNTGFVDIYDIESHVLSLFLTYLYTENLEDESFDSMVKLYAVADKYDVFSLLEKCIDNIVSCFSVENICDVLELADKHQDRNLKEEVFFFFSEHLKEIVNSSCWKKLLVEKPLVAAETAHAIFTKIL